MQSSELLQLPFPYTERKPQRRDTRAWAGPWSHQTQTRKNIAARQGGNTSDLRMSSTNQTTLITGKWEGARVHLCELKRPVGQQRRDPAGTFGQVTVKLGWRFDGVLRHVLVDVLNSALRNTKWWARCLRKTTNQAGQQMTTELESHPHNFKNNHVPIWAHFKGIDL